ncbi:MAG: PQQ-binding-like beta-propeller repeat protein [Bauldia sp.]|nr:PQQ-binding-like beta-propeller repeat protein [Bauldia sp.]
MKYHRGKAALGTALLAGTILSVASSAASAQVTYDRLVNPEPDNWLTHNRTYDGNRYSPLDEITTDNVGDLDLAFSVSLIPQLYAGLGGGLQGTPLVDNGIMYFTDGMGVVYRIDVSSGDRGYINWIMDPGTDPEIPGIANNRGVALLGDTVYSVTRDGYLYATDAATGEVLWDAATQIDPDEYFTAAPLALENAIVLGPAGDAPMRGWIDARSPEDGSQLWHFWIIPGPGEPGGETWPADSDIYLSGASAIWTTGSYDPETNLIYWGTSNPTPFGDPDLRPGDNLYSSSLIVLDGDTGELEWYYQYTPNEQWDYDEIGSHQLYEVDGQLRVSHFGRNGFTYVLDATDGTFINGVQYVPEVTWTAGLDPKTGKPIEYDPALAAGGIQRYAHGAFAGDSQVSYFCPNIQGGVNFQPTTYSLRTGLHYGSGIEGCNGAPPDGSRDRQTGSILAMDQDGNLAGLLQIPTATYGGTVSTAGGLVFSSDVGGDFFAVDDETLEILWNVNLGSIIEAPPIVYGVDGKEFVAIPVGTSGINALLAAGYAERGDDPNAASLANLQRTWTIYVFAL